MDTVPPSARGRLSPNTLMELRQTFLMYLVLAYIVFLPEVGAQSPTASSSAESARMLDTLLQDYAYRAFVHPRTGIEFVAQAPSNFSGITLSAMRLRSGSLKRRGVARYREFTIPIGVVVQPYVLRLVLVYQNLGNWSTEYYRVPGYSLLAPVLGLLPYDAVNLSAKNLPVLGVMASVKPIVIQFTHLRAVPAGSTPRCIWFNLNGTYQLSNLTARNICSTNREGHFSIVVESTAPAPMPGAPPSPGLVPSGGKKEKSKEWKIAAPLAGGSTLLVLFALLFMWLRKYKQKKKFEEMERQAEIGESLKMTSIGNTKAPMASGTRTPPILENEYVL